MRSLRLVVSRVVKKEGEPLREFARQGYKPNIAVQCETSEAVKVAMQRGMGVGMTLDLPYGNVSFGC